MISQKRPFNIMLEPERTFLIDKIAKFAKDNLEFIEKDGECGCYTYVYHKHKFTCPVCKDTCIYSSCENYREPGIVDNELTKDRLYEIGFKIISYHIKPKIRLRGYIEYMQLILDIFGEEKGLKVLDIFARKNIIVAKMICEFIEEKRK